MDAYEKGYLKKLILIFFACLLLMATAAYAGEADVIEVLVTHIADDTYKFDVTVQPADRIGLFGRNMSALVV